VVSNLRFIDLCDRGTLRRVRLCLTTPFGLGIDRYSLVVIKERVSQEVSVALLRIASKIVMSLDLYYDFAAEITLAQKTDSIWLFGVNGEYPTKDLGGWIRNTEQGRIEINLRDGTTSFINHASPSSGDQILAVSGAALGVESSRIVESFSLSRVS
jgi:hypothetical protein